jgi:hypothetical protein
MKSPIEFIRDVGFIIFISGSGVYLTQLMPVSPVYFAFLFGAICIGTGYFVFEKNIRLDAIAALSVILLLYATLVHGMESDSSSLVGYTISILAGIVAYWSYPVGKKGTKISSTTIRSYIWVSIGLGVIEAAYRISHPSYERWNSSQIANMELENLAFYAYKISSIMYQDSNFVGMWLLFTYLIAEFCPIKISKWQKAVLAILVFATLSRAAIAALLLAKYYNLYSQSRYKWIYTINFIVFSGAFFFWSITDDSFLTKIEIFQSAIRYAETSTAYSLNFGVGIGNSLNALGDRASHSFPITLFVETGWIGTILYITLIGLYLRKAPSMIPVVVFYSIAGLSLASFATPYLFAIIAITAKHLNSPPKNL